MSQRLRSDAESGIAETARRVLPGGTFGNADQRDRHRARAGRPRLGRQRQRVHRFPARLGPDAGGPCASGGRCRGAGADSARRHVLRQQSARHGARRRNRRRGAVRGEGAVRLHRIGGRSLRHACRPRLQEARQDPEVRGRLPRHERLRADEPGAEAAREISPSRFPTRPAFRARCATRCWSRPTTIWKP